MGVQIAILPELVAEGTAVARLVAPALVGDNTIVALNFSRSFLGAGSKFVPVMVIGVAAVATEGENPVMVGGPKALFIVNGVLDTPVPSGAVTATGPVVALEGTVATIWVAFEETIWARTPLKRDAVLR